MITKGHVRMVCSDSGMHIYWKNVPLTKDCGLNSGINTFGLWTDSTKAKWQILEKGEDYFRIKVIFHNLPLSQIWSLRLKNEQIKRQRIILISMIAVIVLVIGVLGLIYYQMVQKKKANKIPFFVL